MISVRKLRTSINVRQNTSLNKLLRYNVHIRDLDKNTHVIELRFVLPIEHLQHLVFDRNYGNLLYRRYLSNWGEGTEDMQISRLLERPNYSTNQGSRNHSNPSVKFWHPRRIKMKIYFSTLSLPVNLVCFNAGKSENHK